MKPSFFFYDLETSGLNPKEDRVMQFAGQRTDEKLNIIGEPFNYLIKLTEDVLPDPQAILITGITPQQTIKKGFTEAAFLSIFYKQIATPGTIFIGYNNIQFDDEFIRYMNYRNFYDPYEWQWQDHRSRWDLLNVVRMMRALRPEGINWPVDTEGKPVNSLEKLASLNQLEHIKAHDAFSDVTACMDLARLIRKTQPKLFSYMFKIRNKRDIAQFVTSTKPFIYVGPYQGEYDRSSVFSYLFETVNKQEAMLFDLRYNPLDFLSLSAEQIAKRWLDKQINPLPLRIIKYNRCPAIAPLEVLDEASQTRLKLDPIQLDKHLQLLRNNLNSWLTTLHQITSLLDKAKHKRYYGHAASADSLLYEAFLDEADRRALVKTRATAPADLAIAKFQYADRRLRRLLPLYKARNYPESLTIAEQKRWYNYCQRHLLLGGDQSRYATFVIRLQSLAETDKLSSQDKKILAEVDAWAQMLIPINDSQSAKLGQ